MKQTSGTLGLAGYDALSGATCSEWDYPARVLMRYPVQGPMVRTTTLFPVVVVIVVVADCGTLEDVFISK